MYISMIYHFSLVVFVFKGLDTYQLFKIDQIVMKSPVAFMNKCNI